MFLNFFFFNFFRFVFGPRRLGSGWVVGWLYLGLLLIIMECRRRVGVLRVVEFILMSELEGVVLSSGASPSSILGWFLVGALITKGGFFVVRGPRTHARPSARNKFLVTALRSFSSLCINRKASYYRGRVIILEWFFAGVRGIHVLGGVSFASLNVKILVRNKF